MHPCGLDRICEHPCHETDGVIERVVCESNIVETNDVPSARTDDSGAGLDTCLNDGNVSVERSVTSARQVPQFLLYTNKEPHCSA